MARYVHCDEELQASQPIFVPVGEGTGQDWAGLSVHVTDFALTGKVVAVAIATPGGSLIACLKLDQVACLQDELDRAVAELTGFMPAAGAA